MRTRRGARDIESDNDDWSGFARPEEEEELRPSPMTHWTKWGQQSSAVPIEPLRSRSYGVSEALIPRGKLAATEHELERTKEVLLQYKNYVERRLLRHIQGMEEECAQRGKLCERLKRDNALLLEELERYRALRASASERVSSDALGRRAHSPPWGQLRQASSASYPSPPPLPEREDPAKGVLQMLRARESTLLGQLQDERATRARLEAEHAAAVRRLQERVAELEEKRRMGIDAATIQTLRELLARRDEEIRQLRKLHGSTIEKPLEEGEPQGTETSFLAELRQTARDGVEFAAAMTATAIKTTDAHAAAAHFEEVEQLWEEVLRVTASLPDALSKLPRQLWLLPATAKSMRCAIVAEHIQLALFVGQLLHAMEELRGTLALERREQQVAGDRLREVEEESTALVQRLQQELSEAAQGAPLRTAKNEPAALHRRQKSSSPADAQRCDVATQTLLSAQLSGLQNGGTASLVAPPNAAYTPRSTNLGDLLQEMEALERDNAAKSALIAKLQHQRERFLSGVDAELAPSLSARTAMATSFTQYLLE
ncbi:uncharacterized protein Tco025E_00970 [Trypanosoma conorhini]|uniref:Uncharacterized protein n=1 Tax=Trypanosoma conorhini TaxID=83891 RepID=A0A3R7P094_9TRYP|nr:uncharacterized protein Tco025E_00970 [Trypanosoma conorhini]RNF26736.1 hypothetical protein Tco025E_00970 [Trypanosoma conorhini]